MCVQESMVQMRARRLRRSPKASTPALLGCQCSMGYANVCDGCTSLLRVQLPLARGYSTTRIVP